MAACGGEDSIQIMAPNGSGDNPNAGRKWVEKPNPNYAPKWVTKLDQSFGLKGL